MTPRCKNKNNELEFKAATPRIEFEAITTLKSHLDNAEATRRTQEELEFKAATPRIEFEAITTLKNHLDNAEATRRTRSQNSKLPR